MSYLLLFFFLFFKNFKQGVFDLKVTNQKMFIVINMCVQIYMFRIAFHFGTVGHGLIEEATYLSEIPPRFRESAF